MRVRLGRARHQVVRVEHGSVPLAVHLSEFFADAPPAIRQALVRWIRSGRRARRAASELDLWIETQVAALPPRRRHPRPLRTRGRAHDLDEIARDVLRAEFAGELGGERPAPPVAWGRRAPARARRSLRLGSFDPVERLVRVHPVLDQPAVPRFFVRYVVFHELLHAALEPQARANREGGPRRRRELHGAEFRRRERAFADTARALAWERANVDALIRSARSARPLPSPRRERPTPSLARRLTQLLFF